MDSNHLNSDKYFQLDEFYLDLQDDGSKLFKLPESDIQKRPFPGLRPFKTSEHELFYGRKDQTSELSKKLDTNNFLAVIGSSGTGKSSLVRAGLIPALFGGTVSNAGSNWKIAVCRPGNDPIKNLSIALSSLKAGKRDNKSILEENARLEPLLRSSSYGILDVNKELNRSNQTTGKQNLLVIIDQFEELFRFDRKELKAQNPLSENIEFDFVNLLLKASLKPEDSIYVVLTMRSEFLGDCVKFKGLPEAINKSQYLVPQLDRTQLREVIEGPVMRAGRKISPDLVEILINEVESEKLKENLDQLPILQHALMRTYNVTFKKGSTEKEMLYTHYESIGCMKGALAKHADEIFEKLGKEKSANTPSTQNEKENSGLLNRKQQIAKLIFQALTDSTSDQKGGRRPTELQTIYDIARVLAASEEEINEVVNDFRSIETSFIMPPDNTNLYPQLTLDISHESLMRNWAELKIWMESEFKARELYKKLNDYREQNDRDSVTWIVGILLDELKDWNNSKLYNAAWAARYQNVSANKNTPEEKASLYARNITYLKRCEEEIEAEIALEKARRNKELNAKRNKLLAAIGLIGVLISTSFGIYAGYQSDVAREEKEKAESITQNLVKTQYSLDASLLEAKIATQKAERAREYTESLLKKNDSLSKLDIENVKNIARISQQMMEETSKQNEVLRSKSFEIAKLLAESQIKDESFYGALSDHQKSNTISILTPLKIQNDSVSYKTIVQSIGKSVEAQTKAKNDPNIGLAMSYSALQIDANVITSEINKDIFDNNLFYQQTIDLNNYGYGAEEVALYNTKNNAQLLVSPIDSPFFIFDYKNDRLSQQVDLKESERLISSLSYLKSYTTIYDQYFDSTSQTIYYLTNEGIYQDNLNHEYQDNLNAGYTDNLNAEAEINGSHINIIDFKFSHGVFSSDGKSAFLITDSSTKIRSWSLNDQKESFSEPLARKDNSQTRKSKKTDYKSDYNLADPSAKINFIKVDKYTGKVLLAYSNGTVEIRNNKTGEFERRFEMKEREGYGNPDIRSIDVSKNGIAAALNSATGSIGFFDVNGKNNLNQTDSMQIKQVKKASDEYGYYSYSGYSGSDKIILSPDGRYVCLYGNGAGILYDKELGTQKNIYQSDSYSVGITNAMFLDNNSLIVFDSKLKLLMLDPEFGGVEEVWKSVNKPYLSIPDGIENNLISIKDIEKITDTTALAEAVTLSLDKINTDFELITSEKKDNYFEIAERLNNRLGKLTNYNPKDYLYSQAEINFYKNTKDQIDGKVDYKKIEKRILEISDQILANSNRSEELDSSFMAVIFSELAWTKFFNRDFNEALNMAIISVSLDSTRDIVIKNSPLGFLLSKDFNNAERIYAEYKDTVFREIGFFDNRLLYNYYETLTSEKILFKDVFLQDLNVLEKADIIKPEDQEIIKIRKMLAN